MNDLSPLSRNLSVFPTKFPDFRPIQYRAIKQAQPNNETVNVFDFMTPSQVADVCTGTASLDVTPALKAAANEAASRGGGTVFLPAGLYKPESEDKHADLRVEYLRQRNNVSCELGLL